MLSLYNSLSRAEEPLPDQKKIRLFVCGPTVYDYLHIGNGRTYVFFDFFAKYLRSQGYDVDYLQNITDIDDKIIARATEENKKPEDIASHFTKAYFEDMKNLGVDAVTTYAPATDFITQIVAQIERLADKGFAYEIEGEGWYFDISKDKDYGKLSGRTVEQAEDGVSRIDEAIGKRSKGDFALWKFSKANEPSWPSPLGAGRPGWHIEDTAISEFYFGSQYEIHGGGVDLKFPHHEAEIAQQESASGRKPFVEIWMHVGALTLEGKKMSKSVGNFITIRDFLKKYDANVLRWMVFSHDYKSPMDFSDIVVQKSQKELQDLKSFLLKLETVAGGLKEDEKQTAYIYPELSVPINEDLNTQKAIGLIYEHIRTISQPDISLLPPTIAKESARRIYGFLNFLGVSMESARSVEIPFEVQTLAQEREEFRSNKQFVQSDAWRKKINDLGYEVEDTPRGPFIWPSA